MLKNASVFLFSFFFFWFEKVIFPLTTCKKKKNWVGGMAPA
jgi:hypothetical protein